MMNKSERKKTRRLYIGNVPIGDGAAVAVQSMTKTDTRDIKKTVRQIKQLELAGCEIIRVAVPDMEAARALGEIKRKIKIPLIADIHFNYMLALEAIFQGVDGLRINPGNIGAKWKVKEVVNAAKDKKVPIRIGVNAGSLPKDLLQNTVIQLRRQWWKQQKDILKYLKNSTFMILKFLLKLLMC